MSANTDRPKSRERSLSLDAIRGCAILLVIIYHFKEFELFPELPQPFLAFYGMFGVDLFYVLSGYFITQAVILPETWQPGRFLRARVSRIYPAFLFSIAIFVTGKLYSGQAADSQLLTNVLLHIFMLHNLIPGVGSSINGTFWTLGVEFPYYILMLVIGYFIRESRGFWICTLLMLAICLTWRASVFLYIPTDMGRFFASTQLPGTLDAFALGGIAAKITTHDDLNLTLVKWRWPAFALGMILTIACMNYVSHHAGHYWSWAWTAIFWRSALAISFALIIAACANIKSNQLLSATGLPWLGKISFSLYIYHLLPGYLVRRYLPDIDWPLKLLLASSAALAVSWLSWRFIEIRFHRTAVANSSYGVSKLVAP